MTQVYDDSIFDESEPQYLTVNQMIKGSVIETYNYLKDARMKECPGAVQTGIAIMMNKTNNLAIVDVDIDHDQKLDESTRDVIRNAIVEKLIAIDNQWPIELTSRKGLHIYCRDDGFADELHISKLNSKGQWMNRFIECIQTGIDYVEGDLLGSRSRDPQSLVACVPSKVKYPETGDQIFEYKWLNGNWKSEVRHSVIETLGIIGWKVKSSSIATDKMVDKLLDKICGDDLPELDDDNVSPEQAIECSVVREKPSKELFNALVQGLKGLDVEIHATLHGGKSAKEEVAIPGIVASLYWSGSDDITDADIEEAIDFIKKNCKRTGSCKSKWWEKVGHGKKMFEDGSNKGIGYLVDAVQYHNPEYYDEHVKPLRRDSKAEDDDEFLASKYSLTDFNREKGNFKTEYQYMNGLVKCLAFVDNGNYIIKERTANDTIAFKVIDDNKLKKMLNFDVPVKTSEEEKELQRQRKKKVTECKLMGAMKLLKSPWFSSKFRRFVTSKVIGDDKDVFSEFRPPLPQYSYKPIENKPELIEQWLQLIHDQMFDEHSVKALDHFINTNAYLLQQCKKAPVFFVKYSKTGATGKNWLDNSFQKLYGDYAILELTEAQCNEKHNGGFVGKLYRGRDELSTNNYKDKTANAAIKRSTNKYISARRMGEDVVQEEDFAIDVLNTNEADLYGMLNSNDSALLSRLCIMRFKETPLLKSKYKDFIDVIDEDSFAYSLYCYLKNIDLKEYIAKKMFNRYDSSVVQEQLKGLLPKSSLEDFIETAELPWVRHKFRGEKDECEVVELQDLRDAYNKYMNGSRYKLGYTTLDEELAKYGVTRVETKVKLHGNARRVYRRAIVEEVVEDLEEIKDYNGIELVQ